jgi:hypothetical protein
VTAPTVSHAHDAEIVRSELGYDEANGLTVISSITCTARIVPP